MNNNNIILILNNQIKLIEHNNNIENKKLLYKINILESKIIDLENEIIKLKKN